MGRLGWCFILVAACNHNNGSRSSTSVDAGGFDDAGSPLSDASVDPPDLGPGCGLVTCASAGATCGPIGDGCGNVIHCGTCVAPQTCGGGGVPFQCGGTGCVPRTCAQVGADCGPVADGCGGLLQCGDCAAGQSCGRGGVPSVCGAGDNDAGSCTPQTCAQAGASCGPIGDGCGGVVQCGTCSAAASCGGAGVPSQCGVPPCTPRTCAQAGATCGLIGDGCGGVVDCGSTCVTPSSCGGGGVANTCGIPACTPRTCAQAGAACGAVGNGCGGVIQCGDCSAPASCGGGGVANQCGIPPCTPRTCAQAGAACGAVGDGCGGVIQCGDCSAPASCGGGGAANQCGAPPCTPRTCAQAGAACGAVGDGCGGIIQCGTCSAPSSCGGAGVASQCGTPPCTPRTCAQAGANCGPVGDGCGGIIQCGTCTAPNLCGGGGLANVCGNSFPGGGSFAQCDGGVTTISGVVVAGTDPARGFGAPDPVVNAYVYVPSGPVQPISTGATCDQCASSQPSIVAAITGIDGSFVLTNPPVGDINVVIQLGKWRRVVPVHVNPCADNPLTLAQTHLPRNRNEGNIPRFAVDTGDVDVLECVLRKMGLEDSEFTDPQLVNGLPTSPGRVHFYQARPGRNAQGAGGAIVDSTTPGDSSLWGSQATLNAYDIVLFPCQGGQDNQGTAEQNRVINYANLGGRIFATHFSYTWLYNIAPFSATAAWNINQGTYNSATGLIDTSFPKGQALSQWLQLVGAAATAGQIPVSVVRHDFNSVVAPSQRWMYSQAPDPAMPLHYTFNTPVGAPAQNQCGRVVYSDFHVENIDSSNNLTFPTECSGTPMTPQEKLLEYMLFDLTSCVQPDVPTCTPRTCAQLGYNCGAQGDGCGGILQCGTCAAPATCGGGGVAGVCGGGCTPRTCAQLGYSCGQQGDGCGGVIDCGACTPPASCGGGGVSGVCGGGCTPKTCAQQNIPCGPAGDGCGNQIDCGACAPRDMAAPCRALTCADQHIQCGPAGDGCGGLLQCGDCTPPLTCGGGGVSGQCGGCTPKTCAQAGANCGLVGDGCGHLIDCGTCSVPDSCGGAGMANQCGHVG